MRPVVKPGKILRMKERGVTPKQIARKTGATKKEIERAVGRARG